MIEFTILENGKDYEVYENGQYTFKLGELQEDAGQYWLTTTEPEVGLNIEDMVVIYRKMKELNEGLNG